LSGVEIVFGVCALFAGVTGAWSPCGFSMVETLGPTGHDGGLRTTLASCLTFLLGALAGGVATFGALSLLGAALHTGGVGATAVAAIAVAALAAVGEARGARILPQIRRQVPEHWRRVMPMPLAGGLYGVLLGLGFTTFVLTLAVWALAGMSVALGDPALGLVIGLAFGAGRALPVVAMAPFIDGGVGLRLSALMAERPALLRGLRLADAAALAACALTLGAGPASAASLVTPQGTDPTAAGADVAWHDPVAGGVLLRGGQATALPGTNPALGGALLAYRSGDEVQVVVRESGQRVAAATVHGAQKLAVSDRWLAYRAGTASGGQRIGVQALGDPASARTVKIASGSVQLSRPSLDGDRLVFGVAGAGGSRIVQMDLVRRTKRTLRRSSNAQLLNPSLLGSRLLYVRTSYCYQELRLGPRIGQRGERTLRRVASTAQRDPGHEDGHTTQGREATVCRKEGGQPSATTLWSTALSADSAFFARLRNRDDGSATASIIRLPR
jgi:hypothetical protein